MPRLLVLALLCAACSKAPTGPAYVRRHVDGVATAPCLFWPDRTFTYHVDPALSARTPGDKGRAAIDAAFHSWQAVADGCSDFHFTAATDSAKTNLVVWREKNCTDVAPPNDPCNSDGTCADKYDCWDIDTMTLGLTTVTYSRSTGNLLNTEIQLDGANWLFTTVDAPPCHDGAPLPDCVATDVQNTLTHEIGHAVGFDHTAAAGSTMSATSPLGETSKRVIDMGTISGFCAVYPRGMSTPACMP